MYQITSFPAALRKARKEVYTNGEDMALAIGWSEKTYRQYEKDDSLLPPPEIALRICQVLNKPTLFINYLQQLFSSEEYSPFDLKWFLPLTNENPDLRRDVLTTIKEIRDVVNLENMIIDISLDGRVSQHEHQQTADYLKEINDLIEALLQLKTHLEGELEKSQDQNSES